MDLEVSGQILNIAMGSTFKSWISLNTKGLFFLKQGVKNIT